MSETKGASTWSYQSQGMAKHPALVLASMVALAVVSLVYGASALRIDTDTADMISSEVSFRQHDIAFKRAFPAFRKSIVAVIDGDVPERSEEAAEKFAAAQQAEPDLFTKVELPGGDPYFKRQGLLYLDIDELTTLSDRLAAAQPLLAALAADPNLRGLADFIRLVLEQADDQAATSAELDRLFRDMARVVEAAGDDRAAVLSWRRLLDLGRALPGPRRLVLAEPALDFSSLAPAAPAIAETRSLAKDLGITPENGLRLRLTGTAVLEHEELQAVTSGAVRAGISATVGVALLLVWGLGSFRLIVATLGTLAIGLIITGGLAALLVGRLNLISVTFAVLFVGLGVDFGIHLSLRYKEEIDRRRLHKHAVREALSGVGGPLTLSAVCAGLGFIAFVPTDYRGLAELGIISATGMVVAWAASLVLLPALLDLMPLSPARRGVPAAAKAPGWILRHARPILGLASLLALASLPLLPKVGFDFNPLHLKDPKSESVATFLDLERDPATAANTINAVGKDLAEADAIAARLRALPEIGSVITLSSFVPDDQDEKLGVIDDMAFFLGSLEPAGGEPPRADERAAAFDALIAALQQADADDGSGPAILLRSLSAFAEKTGAADRELLDLERRLTRYLPSLLRQLDLALQAGPVDLDSLPASVREDWINAAGEARVLARPATGIDDNRALARFADAALEAVPRATGTPIIVTEAGRVVIGAFAQASWIALVLITLLLILVLRQVAAVLLVLAPLVLAILYTAATSVLLGLELNFANVIVLPLLLGLGVSGAIHVVMRRRMAGEHGADHPDLALSSTPRAVLFSALTTIASFGSLAVSAHQGMASMGLLLTVAILWSLVCTLVILPALFAVAGDLGERTP